MFESTGGFASATTYAGGRAKTTVKSFRCLGCRVRHQLTRQDSLINVLPEIRFFQFVALDVCEPNENSALEAGVIRRKA